MLMSGNSNHFAFKKTVKTLAFFLDQQKGLPHPNCYVQVKSDPHSTSTWAATAHRKHHYRCKSLYL